MATIGLDKLYYAKITEDAFGNETYGTPKHMAKAMQADLSVELAEATLYADDSLSEVVKEFKSGTLSLGVDDLPKAVIEDLTGARVDNNGVIISCSEDGGEPVAVGFRAKKANGKYRYFWLYRVKFATPSTNLQTKGDSISFSTPTIEGTVQRRNRSDEEGKHPWKAEVTEGETGVPAQVIADWYKSVYEPGYSGAFLTALGIGNLTLSPAFAQNVTAYTCRTTNATNTITATPANGCSAEIFLGGEAIESGESVSWESGENTVTITVTKGAATRTYTVTVIKS